MERSNQDEVVESHPSAKGALGWGTLECSRDGPLGDGLRPSGGAGTPAAPSFFASVGLLTRGVAVGGIALNHEFACKPAGVADAFEAH